MKSAIFLLFLSSCSLLIGGKEAPKSAKHSRYFVNFSLENWEFKNDQRSDYIIENKQDGRILLSNSFCEEFQEESLENLANKTFKTVTNFVPEISKYTTFQDREAYELQGVGLVDGVKVKLQLLNTRRSNCYFDFVGIIPKETKETDMAFSYFLQSVTFK